MRLALALAERGQRGVVINADSAQVYADLAVLSARPAAAERHSVEHRLFGTWDGAKACSAADWAGAAAREVADVHAQGGVPILVGGTGLYFRTLLDGIAPIPEIDPQIRAEVRALPLADAYAALLREDPERAIKLDATDSSRIARALEVARSTGKPMAHWHKTRSGGIADTVTLQPAILLPPRQLLYSRCDDRFAHMLQSGAIEEVAALLKRGLPAELPVMRAIGVPEIAGFLQAKWDIAEAERRGAQATRNYVKRQQTWLRHQPPADWPRFEDVSFKESLIFASLLRD